MNLDIEKYLYDQVEKNLTNCICTQPEKLITSEQLLKNIEKVTLDIKTNGFVIEELKILYYNVSKIIEKNQVIYINETKLNPE